ncbi:MAG: ATP synthase F1 subunit epsilon [Bacteroides sp.]|nr:ATP synthase F1 subunit epsilon [Bacteroides sp.]
MDMTIATPEGIIFEGQVESVKFPGASGAFTVLPRHAALISALTSGKITYNQKGESMEIAIQSGFVEVNKNQISVCVEM